MVVHQKKIGGFWKKEHRGARATSSGKTRRFGGQNKIPDWEKWGGGNILKTQRRGGQKA